MEEIFHQPKIRVLRRFNPIKIEFSLSHYFHIVIFYFCSCSHSPRTIVLLILLLLQYYMADLNIGPRWIRRPGIGRRPLPWRCSRSTRPAAGTGRAGRGPRCWTASGTRSGSANCYLAIFITLWRDIKSFKVKGKNYYKHAQVYFDTDQD